MIKKFEFFILFVYSYNKFIGVFYEGYDRSFNGGIGIVKFCFRRGDVNILFFNFCNL